MSTVPIRTFKTRTPTVLVDGGDGGGPEVEVGQQNDFPLVDGVPHRHAP